MNINISSSYYIIKKNSVNFFIYLKLNGTYTILQSPQVFILISRLGAAEFLSQNMMNRYNIIIFHYNL